MGVRCLIYSQEDDLIMSSVIIKFLLFLQFSLIYFMTGRNIFLLYKYCV
jgi:hypothetical protein